MNSMLNYTKSSENSQWYQTTLIDLVKWINDNTPGNATFMINDVQPSSLDAVAVGSNNGTVIESLSEYPADLPYISVNEWQSEVARCIADGKLRWNSIIHFTRIGLRTYSDRHIQFPHEEIVDNSPTVNLTLVPPNEGRYKKFFRTPEEHEESTGTIVDDHQKLFKELLNDNAAKNGHYDYTIGDFTNMIFDKLHKYADYIHYKGDIMKSCRVVINGFPNLNLEDVPTFLIPSNAIAGKFDKCASKLESDSDEVGFCSFATYYRSSHDVKNIGLWFLMDSCEVKLTESNFVGFKYDLLINIKYHDYNDTSEDKDSVSKNVTIIPITLVEQHNVEGKCSKYKIPNLLSFIANRLNEIEREIEYEGNIFDKTRVIINNKPSKPLDRLFVFKFTYINDAISINETITKFTDTLEYYDSEKHDFMSFRDYFKKVSKVTGVSLFLDNYSMVLTRSTDPEHFDFDLKIDIKYHTLEKGSYLPVKPIPEDKLWTTVFEDHSTRRHYRLMPMSILLNNVKAYVKKYYATATSGPDLSDDINAFRFTINYRDPKDPRFVNTYEDERIHKSVGDNHVYKIVSTDLEAYGRDRFTYENYVDMFCKYCEANKREFNIPYEKIEIQVNKDTKDPTINVMIKYFYQNLDSEATYENS